MLGGAGGGAGLALGLLVLMEMMDTSLRNEKDVEILLHLPVLAMLPAIKAVPSKQASAPALGVAARS
jgi:capsular polysaccharide biosynthesis protein